MQTGNKIEVLRSDNGKENVSRGFDGYLAKRGMNPELSSPYIHEQNGRAEKEIRTY